MIKLMEQKDLHYNLLAATVLKQDRQVFLHLREVYMLPPMTSLEIGIVYHIYT